MIGVPLGVPVVDVLSFIKDGWPYFGGSALIAGAVWRFLDRPRLRVHIRDEGWSVDGHEMVFEAANGGGRPVALAPVVTFRGLLPRLPDRRWWYPGELAYIVPKRWRARADEFLLKFKVPRSRASAGVYELKYDVLDDCNLRLEAHAGSRLFRAAPRLRSAAGRLVYLRVYTFRIEGRRWRSHSVRLVDIPPRQLSFGQYWSERLLYEWRGIPPSRKAANISIEEMHAQRRSRG